MAEAEGKAASTKRPSTGTHTWQKSGFKNGKSAQAERPAQSPKCPECTSQGVWRDGLRYLSDGRTVQRFLCRSCGYRFCEPKIEVHVRGQISKRLKPHDDLTHDIIADFDLPLKEPLDGLPLQRREYVGSHKRTILGQYLNTFPDYNSTRQVRAEENEAKNLSQQRTRKKQAAGATKTDQATVKGKVIDFLWWMEKQGYAKETIRGYSSCLRALLHRNADLFDPESVKEALAKEKAWSQNRRRNVINAYTLFLRFSGLSWEKPRCKVTRKIPFIPMEQEIDDLIAGSSRKVAAFLQLLKETAMRSGEAKRLLWTDIDFERRFITLNQPEKNSLPRIWHVSTRLLQMLNALPKKSLRVFGDGPINSIKSTFIKGRRRLASKLQNPRLLQIHFHTLRHWKATMEYHRTKDILHVKAFLGHKKLDNVAIYVHLDQKLFIDTDEGFTCRVAHNVGEAIALIETGFEYITGEYTDGGKLFRKRK